MANNITNIYFSNTFGDLVRTANNLVNAWQYLGFYDWDKPSGKFSISSTGTGFLANTVAVFTRETRVEGFGSSLYVQNNAEVGKTLSLTDRANNVTFYSNGASIFSGGYQNYASYLTGIGYENVNDSYGIVTLAKSLFANSVDILQTANVNLVQANNQIIYYNLSGNTAQFSANVTVGNLVSNNFIYAANNISTNRNLFVAANSHVIGLSYTDRLQANTSANTRYLSVTDDAFVDYLQANTNLQTGVAVANTRLVTTLVQANNTVIANTVSANSLVTTPTLHGSSNVFSGYIQANTRVVTGIVQANNTVIANTVSANSLVTTPTLHGSSNVFTGYAQANTAVVTGIVQANTNIFTTTISANSSIVTPTVQASSNVYTAFLRANNLIVTDVIESQSRVITDTALANNRIITAILQSNNSIISNDIQANTRLVTALVQANNTVIANDIQANTRLVTALIQANNTVIANTVSANSLVTTPTIHGSSNVFTEYAQANARIVTALVQANNTVITNTVSANSLVIAPTIHGSSNVFTEYAQANTSVVTSIVQANTRLVTALVQANNTVITNTVSANSLVITPTLHGSSNVFTNVLQANSVANTQNLSVTQKVYAGELISNTNVIINNNANTLNLYASNLVQANSVGFLDNSSNPSINNVYSKEALFNSATVVSNMSVGGTLKVFGATEYEGKSILLSSNTPSWWSNTIPSEIVVNRKFDSSNGVWYSSNSDAALSWSDLSLRWRAVDVPNSTANSKIYTNLLLELDIADNFVDTSSTRVPSSRVHSLTRTHSNSAYLHANSAFVNSNSAYLHANSAFVNSNSAYSLANSSIVLGTTPLYLNRSNTVLGGLTTLSVTGTTFSNFVVANTNLNSVGVISNVVQANSAANTQNLSVTQNIFTRDLRANNNLFVASEANVNNKLIVSGSTGQIDIKSGSTNVRFWDSDNSNYWEFVTPNSSANYSLNLALANTTLVSGTMVPTTVSITAGTGLTGGGDFSDSRSLALTGQALALHTLAANGFISRTGSGTVAARSITVSGTGLTLTNGDGISGNPLITSNATNVNTANTIVSRDASGNFVAGTITASLSGNASTATTLQTARTINAVSFNGSANILLPNLYGTNGTTTIQTVGITGGVNYTTITNAANGSPVTISSDGLFDTNVGLNLITKGAGAITLDTGTGLGSIDLKPGASSLRLWDSDSSHYWEFVTANTTTNYTVTLPTGSVVLTPGTMVPNSTTLTIANGNGITGGGSAVDLSANRSWTIGLTGQANNLHNMTTTGLFTRTSGGVITARSIAVSGTGLGINNPDGSAGNPTITSNATSANSSATIVARDANGDFSSRYISATYFNSTDNSVASGVTGLISKTSDSFYRTATAAAVAGFISGQSMNINGTSTGVAGGAGSVSASTGSFGSTLSVSGILSSSTRINASGSQLSTSIATATGSLGGIEIAGGGGTNAAFMAFHRPGAYATYFGLGNNNRFQVGGWSAGAVAYDVVLSDGGSYNLTSAAVNKTLTIVNGTGITGGNSYDLTANRSWTLGLTGQALNLHNMVTNGSLFYRNGSGAIQGINNFAGLSITSDLGGNMYLVNTGASSISGTANQILVQVVTTSLGTADYSLSLPQNIATSSSPTFAGLTVGTGVSSSITMQDTDEGARTIHCNSNRIGFLNQSGGWGSWCNDDGSWESVGNITAYSDITLKKDILTIENSLEKVKNMRGVYYTRKDTEQKSSGVIAQELKEIAPELVKENSDGILSVAYGNLVGYLIEAIKEQQKQIDELKSKIGN